MTALATRPRRVVRPPAAPRLATPARPAVRLPAAPRLATPARPAVRLPAAPPLATPARPAVRLPAAPGLATPARLAVELPAATADVTFRALGTDVRLIASGPRCHAAVATARAEILDYHARLSRFLPASELCALNADARPVVPASALLRSAVRAALWAAVRSGGLVDPCMLDALEAAGYDRSLEPGAAPQPPPSGSLRFAAPDPARRWGAVRVDDRAGTIARPVGLRLDLGGSGKGHAADLVARHLQRQRDWVVDCGGDIRLGAVREIEIAHPLRAEPAARLPAGGAVATSSVVARAWTARDGRHAHHLLDPCSGEPVWTGLLSATAFAPTTLHAETLAKLALLRGPRAARELLARRGGLVVHGDGAVEAIGRPR